MTRTNIRITKLMTRLTALERERAAIVAKIETCNRYRVSRPLLSKLSLRKKPAISSIGIRQSKTRLPCSDGFSAAVRMSSPFVGRTARRGAAATHLPVRMNGSGGFAKSRKSNARHVQTRRSLPSMTCRSNAIYAGPTQKSPRSLWASIRC